MKKFIIFGVVLALLVPTLAMAATEFSLGGFIKMDMMWDSDSGVGKNMNALPARNNDPNAKHGRLKFTAQGSRFNFTIKGPDLWGAKTSGFIEMDFDTTERPIAQHVLYAHPTPSRLACAMPCSGSTGPPLNCCSASTGPCSANTTLSRRKTARCR